MSRRDSSTGGWKTRRRASRRVALAALVATICATITVSAAAGGHQAVGGLPYKVVGKIGKEGKGNGQFSTGVAGLASDAAGNLYVSDQGNGRIQTLSALGVYKSNYSFNPGEFAFDVAVGPTGDVWGTTQVGAQARRFPKGGGASENLATPKSAEGIGIDADGNVYVSTNGDSTHAVVRFAKNATGWDAAATWVGGGLQEPGDVEVSPDGSIYVADRRGSPPNIKRYGADGKLLNSIKTQLPGTAGAGAQYGIAVDPDCNVWATNVSQRRVDKFSASGKLLGTVTSGDLVSPDLAIGPKGDLYVFDINTRSVIHFAEDHSKPQGAIVVGGVGVSGGIAKVRFALTGVACPAQIDATASLTGKGIAGKASVKVAAGKTTVITIPVKASVHGAATATFKIVLRTNGRPTTQTRIVRVAIP